MVVHVRWPAFFGRPTGIRVEIRGCYAKARNDVKGMRNSCYRKCRRARTTHSWITFVVCRSHGDKLTSLMEINVASPRYYATARRVCVKVGRVENGGGEREREERRWEIRRQGGITWKFSTYTVDYCRTEIVVASSPGSLPFFDCSPDTTCSLARTTTA